MVLVRKLDKNSEVNVDMSTPLIDSNGFPRADIDVAQSTSYSWLRLMDSPHGTITGHSFTE